MSTCTGVGDMMPLVSVGVGVDLIFCSLEGQSDLVFDIDPESAPHPLCSHLPIDWGSIPLTFPLQCGLRF